jgi:hypothetical protein
MGFHWPRGTHRTKPWSGGPRRVADRPHFDTHRLKTWRVHSPGGGKEESEEEEAVHPECMADCPCGGRPPPWNYRFYVGATDPGALQMSTVRIQM